MKLTKFLQEVSADNYAICQSKPIICFTAKEYPLLFFALLKKIISSAHPELLQTIERTHKLAELKAQCETQFLGMHRVYWFGDMQGFSKIVQKKWIDYFAHSTGPNTIMFFAPTDLIKKKPKHWEHIELPDVVDKKLFRSLLALHNSEHIQFTNELFSRHKTFSLDTACLFAEYAQLVGKNVDQFFSHWLPRLHVGQTSLFLLSQYFFAKEKQKFYQLWAHVYDQFSPPFWTTFWSEQLWRAAQFTRFIRAGDRLQAKRISYRLPFSFINHDWRNVQPDELVAAHNELYRCDYALKNGASPFVFDLFYTKFFRNQFR